VGCGADVEVDAVEVVVVDEVEMVVGDGEGSELVGVEDGVETVVVGLGEAGVEPGVEAGVVLAGVRIAGILISQPIAIRQSKEGRKHTARSTIIFQSKSDNGTRHCWAWSRG
jgi:hypothetical protein